MIAAELKLILDPQEYDYIIPNKGYVGFYLTVQNLYCSPRQQFNMNNNNDQSIIVGPKFHSYISIQQQYFVRSENHFGTKIKVMLLEIICTDCTSEGQLTFLTLHE
uniref:Uncharacterized protein n=1 Tax=Schistosoma haematobium TaxID=6185 RepID=A0A094ZYA2_SCHHA